MTTENGTDERAVLARESADLRARLRRLEERLDQRDTAPAADVSERATETDRRG